VNREAAMRRTALRTVLVLGMCAAAGCGSVGTPNGKVTQNGAPVAGAELLLYPEATPDQPVVGMSSASGEYRLDLTGKRGVPAGKCRVEIAHYTLLNGQPLPGGEAGNVLKGDDKKSRRNVHRFDVEIAPGTPTLNFELNEGKKGS